MNGNCGFRISDCGLFGGAADGGHAGNSRVPNSKTVPSWRCGDTAPYLSDMGPGGTRPYLPPSGIEKALAEFVNDADMQGTTLPGYAKSVVTEVVGIGRAGSLVDWCRSSTSHHHDGPATTGENRAYVSLYSAEQILNWRIERVNGRRCWNWVDAWDVAKRKHVRWSHDAGIDGRIRRREARECSEIEEC